MKILHYCNSFSSLSETFIYDVIVELESLGSNNIVVANRIVNTKERPFKNVHELKVPKRGLIKRFISNIIRVFYNGNRTSTTQHVSNALLEVVKKERPDIIHAHYGPQGIKMLPVVELLQIPLIVSFHGSDAFRLPTIPNRLVELRKVFDKATCITVVSKMMKEHLSKLGCPSEKLHIIHVGKNLSDYLYKSKPSYPIEKFVSIGRLVEKKGHDDCLRAFKSLIPKYNNLKLLIIGDGELYDKLNQLIIESKLQNNVQLLGGLSHDRTKEVMDEADAFILCSKTAKDGDSEGIPTVLMEAQALGLPCISTNHSGIPEVIPEENHWMLADEANKESIVAKVEDLLVAPFDLIQNATLLGRKKIELEFNLVTEVTKLKKLYSQAKHM